VSASGGGGIVKSRDFVNLRCWKLFKNSHIVENFNLNASISKSISNGAVNSPSDGDNENSSDDENVKKNKKLNRERASEKLLKKSLSVDVINENAEKENGKLSKSFGAPEVNSMSEDEEPYADAQAEISNDLDQYVFVSAAMSIEYPLVPPTAKYIRGDNIISCWAMRHVKDDENACIFEWLLCIDLKGSLPKYVLNTAFVSLMTDYMVYLRSRIQQLNEENTTQCA
jgi:StAR-related lipid transfer protein 3